MQRKLFYGKNQGSNSATRKDLEVSDSIVSLMNIASNRGAVEEFGFGAPQENAMTLSSKQFTRSLSNDRCSVHFSGAMTLNGTLPLIKAVVHCNARDYVNILEQAGVQN